MKLASRLSGWVALTVGLALTGLGQAAPPEATGEKQIPDALKPWQGWALWGQKDQACPVPYDSGKGPICFWPSRLALTVDPTGGRFGVDVAVFTETWVPLPGSADVWPQEVRSNGVAIPVMERQGKPSIKLPQGMARLEGVFRWAEAPSSLSVPPEIGLLTLTLDGKPVEFPSWDARGEVWLKRAASTADTAQDFISVKVYAALEDGIPMWWRSEVELIVSGKSREEDLGSVLPQGWKLAEVSSQIPVAIDDAGRLRAQVRAGKWKIALAAFRLDNPAGFQFAEGVKPAVEEELVAFQAKPDFRMLDIVGLTSIDVSQTAFPEQWAGLPVYRWDTSTEFRLEERVRGMGVQKPEGLRIARSWWLDENGGGLTFRDHISGRAQQIWRLDAAEGQSLGSVQSDGIGQLITRNPQTGAPGVEVRTREIKLAATGRVDNIRKLSATGWQADTDNLKVTLNLPPGWRLFALFGADWVQGDWLTAWTLLDLFLLLVFTFAVFRIFGPVAAVLAFLAFGLSYHETGAPRYIWLALLVPLALLRVVPAGGIQKTLGVLKWVLVVGLIMSLAPFVTRQVQQALYPQMETVYNPWVGGETTFAAEPAPAAPSLKRDRGAFSVSSVSDSRVTTAWKDKENNLAYDAKARIQTGPGVPDWTWRTVSFGWNGPVTAAQEVRPILIPVWLERCLSIARVVLLLALAAILLNVRRWRVARVPVGGARVAAMVMVLLASGVSSGQAQFPDQKMLDTLRERLLEPSDAFPNAAEIPSVNLSLQGRKMVMEAEVHTAALCAVPLPGQLPAWSPITVSVNGVPVTALRRDDGFLYVALSPGVYRVRVEGLLSEATEWEWTFRLKPHQVSITAPDWTFSGVKPDGVPENQVFFALKQKAAAGQSNYDRQDYQTVALVERQIELGLVWQVRTTVTRLSASGRAVSLRIPLLPGENVLTANAIIKDGLIDVRLGANEPSFSWVSEITATSQLKLATKADNTWVERWQLTASPVWNVSIAGLAPTFEPGIPALVPVWHPWPGESVDLSISRPEAIAGATVTVGKVHREISLGQRQRTSQLNLSLKCSLGEDFLLDLPETAEITSLKHDEQEIPVRKDGSKLIIPLRPGEQSINVSWKENVELGFRAQASQVVLPVESANITTEITVPESSWVLSTFGPLRGPAVQFWSVLVCSLLAAIILGRIGFAPLSTVAWMLLAIGLTQVPLPAALVVVGWLFLLEWRGRTSYQRLNPVVYNLGQLLVLGVTLVALGIFIVTVGEGLLGNPEMFISGNESSRTLLRWYEARSGTTLPQPGCYAISLWWYRLLMLGWALWLAASLIRWLRWGWSQFSMGGLIRRKPKNQVPPTLPSEPRG